MTNGTAYVFDEADALPDRYNPELARIARIEAPEDARDLRALVARHRELTGSHRAAELLARWDEALPCFWKVIPLPAEAIAKTIEVAKRGSEVATLTPVGR